MKKLIYLPIVYEALLLLFSFADGAGESLPPFDFFGAAAIPVFMVIAAYIYAIKNDATVFDFLIRGLVVLALCAAIRAYMYTKFSTVAVSLVFSAASLVLYLILEVIASYIEDIKRK